MIRNLAKKSFALSGNKLTAQTQTLADRQTIQDVVGPKSDNSAVTVVNPGKVINFKPIPPSVTVLIENAVSAGDILVFNNDTYKAVKGNATVTYSDGFAGKLINKLINGLQNADGLLCYGFTVTAYDSAGAKSDAVLTALAPEVRYYNGNGDSYLPAQLNIAGAIRNNAFKDGLLTVKGQFNLNMLAQFKSYLGIGEKAQFVFFFEPLVD